MRMRTAFVGLLALTVSLTACGDDGGGTATSLGPTTTPTTATPVQLDTMLLTVDDVGSTWKLGPPINEADLQDSVQVPCGPEPDPALVGRLRAVTGVQFEPVDGSSKHLIEFLGTGEPGQLSADVQALLDAWRACPPSVTQPDGSGYENLEELALPALGDQRMAMRVALTEGPGSDAVWYGRMAVVRVGSVSLSLGLTEILATGATPAISDEAFIAIVTAATGRVTG